MADKQNVIALDVDGTVTISGMPNPGQFAPVQTGTRAFLGALRDRGYKIVVFSARSPVEAVRQFFRQQDLDRFVDGYTRTKPRDARIFVDDRAIPFRGSFADTLAAIDRFRPHWQREHEYGHAGIRMPKEISDGVAVIGKRIKPEDLHEEGLESDPHTTALFGFTEDNPQLLRDTVRGFGPVQGKVGVLGLFEPAKHDVLKLAVDSEDLHRLHRLIRAKVPHVQTHDQYNPHITVGYLKSGRGADYPMLDNPLLGKEFTADRLVFSDRQGRETEIPL